MSREHTRRAFLGTITGSVISLTGCASGDQTPSPTSQAATTTQPATTASAQVTETPTSTDNPLSTPTRSPTSTPTPTENPTPTPTESPTSTLTPTESPTPTPTATPTLEPPESSLPITGEYVPELREFDKTMLQFLTRTSIEGATLGIMRRSEIILQHGYGYQDQETSQAITPTTPLRLASIDKPFRKAALRRLKRDGVLDLDEQVFFNLLDLKPYPEDEDDVDPRLDEITVRHLLNHEGGWNAEKTFDPMFAIRRIGKDIGLETAPTARQLTRWMMGQPLQFDPGSKSVYSNFGSVLWVLVVEAVSDQSYDQYLEQTIFQEAGITPDDVYLGRSLPKNRPARESWYFDPHLCTNDIDITSEEKVPCPHGGVNIQISFGLVANVRGLLNFIDTYWFDGRPRMNENYWGWFAGSLPGTWAIAYQVQYDIEPKVNIAVLLNRRKYKETSSGEKTTAPKSNELAGLRSDLEQVAKTIETWPGN